jgi:hypothetical protein
MYANGGFMKDFEHELDEIRIKLYEETKELDTEEIIKTVNYRAEKIANEYGIIIKNSINENYFQTVTA